MYEVKLFSNYPNVKHNFVLEMGKGRNLWHALTVLNTIVAYASYVLDQSIFSV